MVGGAAAVWLSILTKVVYYRLPYFLGKRNCLVPVLGFYVVCTVMVVWRTRMDLVIALGSTVV